MKKIVVIIVLGIIIYGCKSTLYMPASKDATQQQQLLAGRSLYVAHCGSCHNLHFPSEFTTDEWKVKIGEMQKRAKITDEEKELVLKYLISY
jgi:hypothetical protein